MSIVDGFFDFGRTAAMNAVMPWEGDPRQRVLCIICASIES